MLIVEDDTVDLLTEEELSTVELNIVEPPCTVELLQTVALSSVALSIVDC